MADELADAMADYCADHSLYRSLRKAMAETGISLSRTPPVDRDEDLARLFHETYERLAPSFSYQTRKASAVPWADVPPNNKALMIAVCQHVRASIGSGAGDVREALLELMEVSYHADCCLSRKERRCNCGLSDGLKMATAALKPTDTP